MITVAGAVNGAPAIIRVRDTGDNLFNIPFARNGVAGTQDLGTDSGSSFAADDHRVAIIGGSTAGRDHFPFPVVDFGSVAIDPLGGFSLTLETASRWFWLVKTWQVHARLTATLGGDSFVLDISHDFSLGDIGRESNLVSPENQSFGFHYDEGNNNLDFTISPKQMQFAGDFFFPMSVRASADDTGMIIQNYPTGMPHNFDEAITCDGVSSEVFADFGDPDREFDEVFIVITPVDFWEYATKAGLPVYDTSTGAQLRDPFS